MSKFFFIILLIISLSHCSISPFDTIRNIDGGKEDNTISKLDFNKETSFDEFKKNIIKYGSFSDFPKLD
tara:strand:- start:193 stop:399 length:207 start_codon:yes stop_codon:yes gene_type:complete